jgi:hypothetical protein
MTVLSHFRQTFPRTVRLKGPLFADTSILKHGLVKNKDVRVTLWNWSSISLEYCCDDGDEYYSPDSSNPRHIIARQFGHPVPAPLASSSVSGPSSTPAAAQPTEWDLSNGVNAGFGVGIVFSVVTVLVLGIFISRPSWRRRVARNAALSFEISVNDEPQTEKNRYPVDVSPHYQLEGTENSFCEMDGSRPIAEVYSSSVSG